LRATWYDDRLDTSSDGRKERIEEVVGARKYTDESYVQGFREHAECADDIESPHPAR
jgi:hypothetical protein